MVFATICVFFKIIPMIIAKQVIQPLVLCDIDILVMLFTENQMYQCARDMYSIFRTKVLNV